METVISRDGTKVGFTKVGQGPGLILVQGAMGTAYNYRDLAEALSSDFTVYTADRRGRGMSPKTFALQHEIQRDVEDIEAIIRHSAASMIFGLSSGGVIALTSALRVGTIHKAVIYEPPFYFQNGIDQNRIERFHREVANQNWVEAMTAAGEIVKLAPLPIRLLPRSFRKRLAVKLMDRLRGVGYARLDELLAAMLFDFQVVGEMSQQTELFKGLDEDVLLLGGTRSPRYLKQALQKLASTLPRARSRILPGLDHAAPWNADIGGAPLAVAEAVRTFLLPRRAQT